MNKDEDGKAFYFFAGALIAVVFCGFINVISESACAPTPAICLLLLSALSAWMAGIGFEQTEQNTNRTRVEVKK